MCETQMALCSVTENKSSRQFEEQLQLEELSLQAHGASQWSTPGTADQIHCEWTEMFLFNLSKNYKGILNFYNHKEKEKNNNTNTLKKVKNADDAKQTATKIKG